MSAWPAGRRCCDAVRPFARPAHVLHGLARARAELYRTGVVECCVPLEQLMPEAMQLAAEIASKSPIGMRYAKQSMNTTMHMPARDGYRFEQGVTVLLSKTEDAQEARPAFVEKRKPVFKGR